ncbi:MAG TPA: helical backbone metal receptor [Gemmatimonadales bacterium]|nr:helical backbone metal receptor [Gemmatimonadales bacterium]
MGTLRRALHLLPFLAAVACAPAPAGRGPLVGVDDAGDTVRLARPALRVVSLIPASTELLFAIGAGPQVVGRTRWCDYPAAAAAVPDVGDGIGPNLEAVTAQHPDLVVLYLAGSNAEAATRLRAMGIPVVQLRTDQLESVAHHAILLGELTGRRDAGDSLAQAFEAALAAATVSLHPAARTPRRQTVFIPTWDQPLITIGAGSFLDELVTRAGGVNVFHDLPQASAPVSLEAVAARDPDLILTTAADAPAFQSRPEWQVLRAVRERRFVRVHGSEFDRPSPRSPQAIAALTAALYAAQR